MEKVLIQKLLADYDIDINEIALGDFDYIGEYTAKKSRDRNSPLYNSVGSFFRPNYERGILIYSLIKKFKLKSYLEVGFGRGYSAVCAAKAFHDIGVDGKVISVDPTFNKEQLEIMSHVFPREWLEKLDLRQGYSQELLKHEELKGPWDLIYIDGDHRAPAVKADWENLKDRWGSFLLFDDYHLPTKAEADIECAHVIDSIEVPNATKKLIIMDRRIFIDDRRFTDDQIDYGQVLLEKNSVGQDEW